MVKWRVVYARQAQKDAKKIAAADLRPKAEKPAQESVSKPSTLRKTNGRPFRCIFTSHQYSAPSRVSGHGRDKDGQGRKDVDTLRVGDHSRGECHSVEAWGYP